MRLGIDFGTTRTVVACCDRGNYPVVSFFDDAGESLEWYPSVVAERDGELRFGLDAVAVANEPDWHVTRSFKRLLASSACAASLEVEVGGTKMTLGALLVRFFEALRRDLLERSNMVRTARDEPLSIVLAAPANAHGAQRFVTIDSAERAGLEVLALLNEPSAAGFEYTHRHPKTLTSRREHVVVYDLGGGTFDASLVRIRGQHHEAVATGGIARLGGDDFDEELVELALGEAGLDGSSLSLRALLSLGDVCRDVKERLHPSSRKITIDLESALQGEVELPPWKRQLTLPVARYYEVCAPLVERTIEAMLPVMARLADEEGDEPLAGFSEVAGIYVVGGASSLPVVARVLRERFGRRVHRSPYPSAATAIGLAIAADEHAGFELSDRLSRNFGVFRESEGGARITFDPIFHRDLTLPSLGGAPVVWRRVYRAAHNVGHYRFAECGEVGPGGVPLGDVTPYPELMFPFDAELRANDVDLARVPVRRTSAGPLVEERYTVGRHGIVEVTITDLDTGFARAYQVGS
jgi:molecular chaperone DnaK (HSP70)